MVGGIFQNLLCCCSEDDDEDDDDNAVWPLPLVAACLPVSKIMLSMCALPAGSPSLDDDGDDDDDAADAYDWPAMWLPPTPL